MPPADNIDLPVSQSHLTLEERIRRRAYELHQQRPEPHNEMDDWLDAEREILGGRTRDAAESRGSVVGHAGRPGIVL